MSSEVEENLTLFFRHFLNTLEEMDAHLGFRGSHWRAPGLRSRKPQMGVHVGVGCQVHYEKASEKDPHALLLSFGEEDDFVGSPEDRTFQDYINLGALAILPRILK
jgi:hypothetical protein